MAAGVKFLILGASLVGASCGGYVIYKNVSGSETEKTNPTDDSKGSKEQETVNNTVNEKVTDPNSQGSGGTGSSQIQEAEST